MGWKLLKDTFGITRHIVHVIDKGICIGSELCRDIVVIQAETGQIIRMQPMFSDYIRVHYQALHEAEPAEIARLIAEPDSFKVSIPVYTYDDGTIIEKSCETPGWPNVTHDGQLMYDNTFSTSKEKVIEWAKRNIACRIEWLQEDVARQSCLLDQRFHDLALAKMAQEKLVSDYPTVQA